MYKCGVLVVGLSDWPGQQVHAPVLVMVAGPWKAVGGCCCCPVHLELCGSRGFGSPLLQPPILCRMFARGLGPHVGVSLRRSLGLCPTG